jgi:GAF domain-containing protein
VSPTPDGKLADPDQIIADLKRQECKAELDQETAERDALQRELVDAGEQQAATAEVLQVINSSRGDLEPVFYAMLEKAAHLCDAGFGILWTYDGERFHAAALHGVPSAFAEFARNPISVADSAALGDIVRGHEFVHVIDLAASKNYRDSPLRHATVDLGGARTGVAVPLRKDSSVLGVFVIYRQEVRAFSDKQIALLQNFAAQAVIAIENARMITETHEALEQQTASAEVLQIINSSPGDLAPVFVALVDKAIRLCDAVSGTLWTCDGERFDPITVGGASRLGDWFRQHGPTRAAPDPPGGRLLIGERVVHISDVRQDPAYRAHPRYREMADLENCRTLVAVGLRKEDTLLGMITAYRQEIRPFSDKQITLLQNFADQAVIAMENARLITETREALEQQTAAAEVLEVINSSPGDLMPVFDAMLEKATRLCDAGFGTLWTFDGDKFHTAALRNVPVPYGEFLAQTPYQPDPQSAHGRITRGERVIHLIDLAAGELYRRGDPLRRATVDLGGARSALAVPLRKDETLLGIIVIYRQEVRPFSDKHIVLVQNFATQAVIAIENARLLAELRERTRDLEESLEYQTATSDVLKVISRSTFHLQPVLDSLVETAAQLCGADNGSIATRDGEVYRVVANFALTPEWNALVRTLPFRPGRDSVTGRTLLERQVVQIADITVDQEYKLAGAATVGKIRTVLGVPLLREGDPIGVMQLSRTHVELFTERQIELVRTFADQAVIAIENTRLLTELRESLGQQTATAEVLRIINSSPGDLAPVFDTILEKAHSLCGSGGGALVLSDGGRFRAVAVHGLPKQFAEFARRPFRGNPITQRLRQGERMVHIPDVAVSQWDQRVVDAHLQAGTRAILAVPLRKDEALLGYISAARPEVGAFAEREISLLENFGAQAVIAMDNARLLDEVRQRQAELRVTFDNMGDGVVMFDSELRLAAWNRNLQELLDLPETFLAERPSSAEYFRYLVDRGEYGSADLEEELSRAIEDTTRDLHFERARPDGRVIEVRRNTVPGGGFVLIYGDITERKRAEAEIRGARDAAEKALRELQAAQAGSCTPRRWQHSDN